MEQEQNTFEKANINWLAISESLKFFTFKGFRYKELPWVVPSSITELTCINGAGRFTTELGDLVGSGEQSFLSQYYNLKGAYMTVTPCFRDEPIDDFHHRHFIKLELFDNENVTDQRLEEIVGFCIENFESYDIKPEIIETNEGFDIEYKGVELGSYGIRKVLDMSWIYATGMAEPRLSMVLKNL